MSAENNSEDNAEQEVPAKAESADNANNTADAPGAKQGGQDNTDMVSIVYVLYLSSIILGITGIVGLVMAYIYRKEAPEWAQTHFTYQIHTFWKGLLYSVVGIVLSFVLIGFLVLLGVVIWWIIRCVVGLKATRNKEPIKDPTGWLI